MDLQLTGKTALVSGSTAGIGFAIAKELAQEGANVTINGRSSERVQNSVGRIQKTNPKGSVSGIAADLGTISGISVLIESLPAVDILINNLGIFEPKEFSDITDADWFRFFEVNVMSGVRLARHYLPAMVHRNWGRILFMSSESAVQIPTEMIHYGMTKTAQLAIARGLAESVAGTGVTVNSVLPGPTRSEGVGGFVEGMAKHRKIPVGQVEKEFFEHTRPTSLLRRFATVEEVAAMVTYLASPRSSATNGAALRVDGGVVRSIL